MKEVKVTINCEEVDTYVEKAQKYVDLLKEAKTLAEELASVDFEVGIKSFVPTDSEGSHIKADNQGMTVNQHEETTNFLESNPTVFQKANL